MTYLRSSLYVRSDIQWETNSNIACYRVIVFIVPVSRFWNFVVMSFIITKFEHFSFLKFSKAFLGFGAPLPRVSKSFRIPPPVILNELSLIVPKTVSGCNKWKIWNILCLQASNFAPKMRVAFVRQQWQLARSSSSVDNICLSLNKIYCSSSN